MVQYEGASLDPARSAHGDPSSFPFLDNLAQKVVVLDANGDIQYANRAWRVFAADSSCTWSTWQGRNYLRVCERAAATGDAAAAVAAHGIRDVIADRREEFEFEYPEKGAEGDRWYRMRASRCEVPGEMLVLLEHHDVTRRVVAERKLRADSRHDPLTGLPNRRVFGEAVESEWRRCLRARTAISLAIVDPDGLTHVNETYGHLRGDDYLKHVGLIVSRHGNRASDVAARFGPDAFALLLGNTAGDSARHVAERLRRAVAGAELPNSRAHRRRLTVSIGVATAWPSKRVTTVALLRTADDLRYQAKGRGGDRVRSGNVDVERKD